MSEERFKVMDAKILQVIPLPAVMIDHEENLTIALALCEFTIKWEGNVDLVVKRDIFPVGNDGAIRDLPGDDAYYLLHAFGDLSHDNYIQVAPDDVLDSEYDEMVKVEQDKRRRWKDAQKADDPA